MDRRWPKDPTNKPDVFNVLRPEIRAARLKVTLDEQPGRETSSTVKLLAGMTLPPMVLLARPSSDAQAESAGRGMPLDRGA